MTLPQLGPPPLGGVSMPSFGGSAIAALRAATAESRKSLCLVSALLLAAACAGRVPPRPSGDAAPDPSAIQIFTTATSHCAGLKTMTAELGLSGRAGGESLRGRVHTGLQQGGAVRLEGVAPFGAPIFILAGSNEAATLLLPRDRRVLRDAKVADVMERLTGLAIDGDDLRRMLSGCPGGPEASDGRQWRTGWKAVTLAAARTAYLREQGGRWVIAAADIDDWRVDYAEHLNGYPRRVRIRTADGGVDLSARVGELEVNRPLDAAVFSVAVPPGTESMTLDELRSVAPLRAPQ